MRNGPLGGKGICRHQNSRTKPDWIACFDAADRGVFIDICFGGAGSVRRETAMSAKLKVRL